jgi:hypothetical protein
MLKLLFYIWLLELEPENESKKLHFMEIDWLVCFPKSGNKGKYLGYNVMLIDRTREEKRLGRLVTIKEIVENPEFEMRFPHTVGFYKEFAGEGSEFKPEYLQIRKIESVEDFWQFLNALDL